MVRVLGYVKGYTPVKVNLAEGRKLRINVSTDLLSPAGKEIVGILHFNGTKIYLQKGQRITIGSSKKCDIRIKDERIEDTHLIIKHAKDGFELEPMSINGNIAVVDEKTKQVAALSLERFDFTTLAEGGRIFFELSSASPDGKKRLLEMRLEIPQAEFTQAVCELLAAKPIIEQIAPEQALARIEDQPDQNASQPINDIIALIDRISASERKLGTLDSALIGSGAVAVVSFMVSATSVFMYFLPTFMAPLFPYLLVAIATLPFGFAGALCARTIHKLVNNKEMEISALISERKDILDQIDPKALAKALAKSNVSDRQRILSLLDFLLDEDALKAVRAELRNIKKLSSHPQEAAISDPTPLLPEAVPTETIPAEDVAEREKVPVGRS